MDNQLKFSYYGLQEAMKNGEFPLNDDLNHVCYFNDEFYLAEFCGHYSIDLTEVLFHYYCTHKVDVENKDKDYSVKFTEIWYDNSTGELLEVQGKETTYADCLVREFSSLPYDAENDVSLVNDILYIPDDYLY